MLHGLDLGSDYDAHDMRVAIVVARWNALITDRLAQGAVEALRMAHAPNPYITHAPGAFELPIVAQALACDLARILAIDQNLTRQGITKAHEQGKEGGLARPTCPHKGHGRPTWHAKRTPI